MSSVANFSHHPQIVRDSPNTMGLTVPNLNLPPGAMMSGTPKLTPRGLFTPGLTPRGLTGAANSATGIASTPRGSYGNNTNINKNLASYSFSFGENSVLSNLTTPNLLPTGGNGNGSSFNTPNLPLNHNGSNQNIANAVNHAYLASSAPQSKQSEGTGVGIGGAALLTERSFSSSKTSNGVLSHASQNLSLTSYNLKNTPRLNLTPRLGFMQNLVNGPGGAPAVVETVENNLNQELEKHKNHDKTMDTVGLSKQSKNSVESQDRPVEIRSNSNQMNPSSNDRSSNKNPERAEKTTTYAIIGGSVVEKKSYAKPPRYKQYRQQEQLNCRSNKSANASKNVSPVQDRAQIFDRSKPSYPQTNCSQFNPKPRIAPVGRNRSPAPSKDHGNTPQGSVEYSDSASKNKIDMKPPTGSRLSTRNSRRSSLPPKGGGVQVDNKNGFNNTLGERLRRSSPRGGSNSNSMEESRGGNSRAPSSGNSSRTNSKIKSTTVMQDSADFAGGEKQQQQRQFVNSKQISKNSSHVPPASKNPQHIHHTTTNNLNSANMAQHVGSLRKEILRQLKTVESTAKKTESDLKKLQSAKHRVESDLQKVTTEQERTMRRNEEMKKTLFDRERELMNEIVQRSREEVEQTEKVTTLRKMLKSANHIVQSGGGPGDSGDHHGIGIAQRDSDGHGVRRRRSGGSGGVPGHHHRSSSARPHDHHVVDFDQEFKTNQTALLQHLQYADEMRSRTGNASSSKNTTNSKHEEIIPGVPFHIMKKFLAITDDAQKVRKLESQRKRLTSTELENMELKEEMEKLEEYIQLRRSGGVHQQIPKFSSNLLNPMRKVSSYDQLKTLFQAKALFVEDIGGLVKAKIEESPTKEFKLFQEKWKHDPETLRANLDCKLLGTTLNGLGQLDQLGVSTKNPGQLDQPEQISIREKLEKIRGIQLQDLTEREFAHAREFMTNVRESSCFDRGLVSKEIGLMPVVTQAVAAAESPVEEQNAEGEQKTTGSDHDAVAAEQKVMTAEEEELQQVMKYFPPPQMLNTNFNIGYNIHGENTLDGENGMEQQGLTRFNNRPPLSKNFPGNLGSVAPAMFSPRLNMIVSPRMMMLSPRVIQEKTKQATSSEETSKQTTLREPSHQHRNLGNSNETSSPHEASVTKVETVEPVAAPAVSSEKDQHSKDSSMEATAAPEQPTDTSKTTNESDENTLTKNTENILQYVRSKESIGSHTYSEKGSCSVHDNDESVVSNVKASMKLLTPRGPVGPPVGPPGTLNNNFNCNPTMMNIVPTTTSLNTVRRLQSLPVDGSSLAKQNASQLPPVPPAGLNLTSTNGLNSNQMIQTGLQKGIFTGYQYIPNTQGHMVVARTYLREVSHHRVIEDSKDHHGVAHALPPNTDGLMKTMTKTTSGHFDPVNEEQKQTLQELLQTIKTPIETANREDHYVVQDNVVQDRGHAEAAHECAVQERATILPTNNSSFVTLEKPPSSREDSSGTSSKITTRESKENHAGVVQLSDQLNERVITVTVSSNDNEALNVGGKNGGEALVTEKNKGSIGKKTPLDDAQQNQGRDQDRATIVLNTDFSVGDIVGRPEFLNVDEASSFDPNNAQFPNSLLAQSGQVMIGSPVDDCLGRTNFHNVTSLHDPRPSVVVVNNIIEKPNGDDHHDDLSRTNANNDNHNRITIPIGTAESPLVSMSPPSQSYHVKKSPTRTPKAGVVDLSAEKRKCKQNRVGIANGRGTSHANSSSSTDIHTSRISNSNPFLIAGAIVELVDLQEAKDFNGLRGRLIGKVVDEEDQVRSENYSKEEEKSIAEQQVETLWEVELVDMFDDVSGEKLRAEVRSENLKVVFNG